MTGQANERSFGAGQGCHHSVRAGAGHGNLVGLRNVSSDHRLPLTVQLEEDVSGGVQTCAVPLLSLNDARLAGLPGLRLDGDNYLVVILKTALYIDLAEYVETLTWTLLMTESST